MGSPGSRGESLCKHGRSRSDSVDKLAALSRIEADPRQREAPVKQALNAWKQQVQSIPRHRRIIFWPARSKVDVIHRADNWLEVPWITISN